MLKKGIKIAINDDYILIRGAIQRVFAWLKIRFRKLETRYEYYASNFNAFTILLDNWKILR